MPVPSAEISDQVFTKMIQTDAVTLTFEELFTLSPDLHAQYSKWLTPKHLLTLPIQVVLHSKPQKELVSPTAFGKVAPRVLVFAANDPSIVPDAQEVSHSPTNHNQQVVSPVEDKSAFKPCCYVRISQP